MMLEQSLISPNFLGKDSFRWFIGVVSEYYEVADPQKGGGYKADRKSTRLNSSHT